MQSRRKGHTVQCESVELVDAVGETDEPKWNQIARFGAWRGHPAGPFELNERIFAEIIANFNATKNRRIPVDFEHASEADPTSGDIPTRGAPAQGWIVDLRMDAQGLWGLVEWGGLARQYIKDGSYKFVSPTIRFNSKDRVTGNMCGARLTSAAMTNQPFLDDMMPLAARDDAPDEGANETEPQLTGPTPEEKGEAPMDMTEVLTAKDAKIDELVKLSETSHAELAKLALQLKDVGAQRDALSDEVVALREWKAQREEHDLTARVEEAFETYRDVKKLSDADRAGMTIVLRHDPQAFDAMYPKVRKSEQLLQRVIAADAPATKVDPTPNAGPIQLSIRERALAIARKSGMSIGEAMLVAARG